MENKFGSLPPDIKQFISSKYVERKACDFLSPELLGFVLLSIPSPGAAPGAEQSKDMFTESRLSSKYMVEVTIYLS